MSSAETSDLMVTEPTARNNPTAAHVKEQEERGRESSGTGKRGREEIEMEAIIV